MRKHVSKKIERIAYTLSTYKKLKDRHLIKNIKT